MGDVCRMSVSLWVLNRRAHLADAEQARAAERLHLARPEPAGPQEVARHRQLAALRYQSTSSAASADRIRSMRLRLSLLRPQTICSVRSASVAGLKCQDEGHPEPQGFLENHACNKMQDLV